MSLNASIDTQPQGLFAPQGICQGRFGHRLYGFGDSLRVRKLLIMSNILLSLNIKAIVIID